MTASKLSTYMLKMASSSNTNLFSNWTDIHELEAVTVSFAGMELFWGQGSPPHLQTKSALQHCFAGHWRYILG